MSTLATPPPDRVGLLHRGGQVAALDGVRALAVIAVVAHHLIDAARERGGYLGVSTFFTLSGFLITSLLVRDVEAGGVSLPRFWARRVRRLWPAAALNVGLILALVRAGRLPSIGVFGDTVSVFANVTNWRFVAVGRAAPLRLVSPFIPQWSLSVEEQFYLVVPLVVALVAAFVPREARRRALAMVLGLTVAVSTWLSVAFDHYLLSEFYRTEVRAAELGVGGLLALAVFSGPPVRSAIADMIGLIGLGISIALWSTVSPTAEWVRIGGFTAVAVASAALIVGALGDGWVARWLGAAPLAAIGRRSYGIYLFHWPLFLALRTGWFETHAGVALGLQIGATLVLAELSYRCIEMPIRRGRLLAGWSLGAAVVGVSGALAAIAFVIGT